MCFSAGASFTGGVVLSVIGVASMKKNEDPSQKLFAGIPLLFAFQQFSEGIVWLTLKSGGNDQLQSVAAFFFLLMALVIWPTLMPLAVFRMEKVKSRRLVIKVLLIAGILLSVYYACCLLLFNVFPRINGYHIQYINAFPRNLANVAFGIYAFASIAPLFFSSVKKMYLFGFLIMFSCIVTGIFYKEYLTSVWCFFAALISVVIYVIIKEPEEETLTVSKATIT